jgi:hypothetical protein
VKYYLKIFIFVEKIFHSFDFVGIIIYVTYYLEIVIFVELIINSVYFVGVFFSILVIP